MVLKINRRNALAFRVARHGFDRATGSATELRVLRTGVQDSGADTPRIALTARLAARNGDLLADDDLAVVWSLRGSMHVHRTSDLPDLAAALWPVDGDDALSRAGAFRSSIKKAGLAGLDAYATVVEAWRKAVDRPMTKADASAAVTAVLPDALVTDCPGCKSRHVFDPLFRATAMQAGVVLEKDCSPPVLHPAESRPAQGAVPTKLTALIRDYLGVLGPTTQDDVTAWLGVHKNTVQALWPDDLVEVSIDGKPAVLPAEQMDALQQADADATADVRLLPPTDPYLQSKERELLVPDAVQRDVLWKSARTTGAVLVGPDLVGAWKAKSSKGRLQLTITAFGKLNAKTTKSVEAEAELVAAARGLSLGGLHFDGA